MKKRDGSPSFFVENDCRDRALDPFKNLAYAMIERAAKDVFEETNSYIRRDSEHWIKSNAPETFLSFVWCAEILELHPNYLREAILKDALHGELSKEKRESRKNKSRKARQEEGE